MFDIHSILLNTKVMRPFLKRGAVHLVVLGVFVVLFILFAVSVRRYVYLSYQKLGSKVGLNLNNIASSDYVDHIKAESGEFENQKRAVFLNRSVEFQDAVASNVLGQATTGQEKWIEVDLSEQRLYMREGAKQVGTFLVSTGKWSPTPTGEWRIWTKLRYTRMKGGSKALGTFYDLPNVPYTMYYYKGYGIHGAYWHNNFGQPMSHGCVNVKPEEAGIVFNWASVGTRVVVHQ